LRLRNAETTVVENEIKVETNKSKFQKIDNLDYVKMKVR
jgi:hypothetical protein